MSGVVTVRMARTFSLMTMMRSSVIDHLFKASPKDGMNCPPEMEPALCTHANHLLTIVLEIALLAGGLLRHIHFNMLGHYRNVIVSGLPVTKAALRKPACIIRRGARTGISA